MKDAVFITDLHLMTQCNVRTGDVIQDLAAKLNFVVDYCNKNNACLLLGGDVFDKPCLPDFVKSVYAPIFAKVENGVYSVVGNHSRLYDNPEYNYKTTYNVFVSTGIFNDLDSVEGYDMGDFYLTGQVPVTDKEKPQIVCFHGFLNQEDGRNTFRYQDLKVTNTPTYVCLGHDHIVYDPLQYNKYITIFRPGSLLRGIRSSDQERQPQLLHISVDGMSMSYKYVEIPARKFNEIFKTKEAKAASKVEIADKYEDIISKIRNAQVSNVSFEQALKQVADDETVFFTMKVLDQAKLEKSLNKSRL